MNVFEKNISTIFGEKGKRWLGDLPRIVNQLANEWGLTNITPVDNMTFNYVAKAFTLKNKHVVLKIGCDEKTILSEKQALEYFDGCGSIELIASNDEFYALLLQQAFPGISLKSLYPEKIKYVVDCYVNTMRKLHSKPLTEKHHYPHIRDWLKSIDKFKSGFCPQHLITKAVKLKTELLDSINQEVFLHGDLHHDNILQHEDLWLAIDPKGIIGEAEFEIAAFDFMYIDELCHKSSVKDIFNERVDLIAQKAQLNPHRIRDWVFVRLILMAAWQSEDHCDPSVAIKLAKMLM